MYSVRERKNKDGSISYNIQVKIIAYDGKEIQKSKTWKPERRLTEKQTKLAISRIADEFEKTVITEYAGKIKPKISKDSFFDEVAFMWLETIKENKAPSYYSSSKNAVLKIMPFVSEYRLRDFSPALVEEINNKIDNIRVEKYAVSAKSVLYDIIKKRYGYRFLKTFSEKIGINKRTLKDAVKSSQTSYETAKIIADGLSIPIDSLFNVKVAKEHYKSSYYEMMKKVIRGTLRYAVKLGVIERNYAEHLYVTTRHSDKKKVNSLTKYEVSKLIIQCQKSEIRKKLAIMFLLFTGARKGEICGLNWSDIDFDNKRVSIKRQYESVSGVGLILSKPKTKSSIRNFEIPDCLIDIFLEYKIWYNEKKELLGEKWEGVDDAVFVGRYGKRLHPTTIRNWFDEILESAGIKHYSVHSLRHTNVTLLLASNVPVVTVSQRVGHAKCTTTLNIYADYLADSDVEASKKLGQYFESAENECNIYTTKGLKK